MRPVLCGGARGASPRLASEDADLHFILALLEVENAALTTFADEQGSPVGPNLVAVDDVRSCQVVRNALLVCRCHFLTPCFEAAGAPLSLAPSSGASTPSERLSSGAANDRSRLEAGSDRDRPGSFGLARAGASVGGGVRARVGKRSGGRR